jgi:hypothetical protein
MKFRLSQGAPQLAKAFAVTRCVPLPCWRFYVKTPTQNLNLLIHDKTLVTRSVNSFGAHKGSSKRERLGAFSWFVLCRVAKNEHHASANAHAVLCERPATQSVKNAVSIITLSPTAHSAKE